MKRWRSTSALGSLAPYGRVRSLGEIKRPDAPALYIDQIPVELKQREQWVCWEWGLLREKWHKFPISPLSGDTVQWGFGLASFDEALQFLSATQVAGIGFSFTKYDEFVALDLDNCLILMGALDDWAREIIEELTRIRRYPQADGDSM